MRISPCLLASLSIIAACSRPVSMDSGWQPGARPATPYGNVLVVAVSEDFDRRRLFENAVVNELGRGGTTATPSSRTMRTSDVLDRESVTDLVRRTGADAVLVTRLVNEAVGVKEKPEREVLKAGVPEPEPLDGDPYTFNVYRYDYSVAQEPAALVIDREATLRTDLFETKEGNLQYTVRSTVRITSSETLDQNTDVAVIDRIAGELVRQLRWDGVVR